jgi:hypothetical protein
MEKHSIVWEWTQPYRSWQPMANHGQTQDEVIEQKLQTQDLAEAQALLARIMAL